MNIDPKQLDGCGLFDGVDENDRLVMLECLGAKVLDTERNRLVFQEGDPANCLGIVLTGSVHVIREDYYGNRSILAHIGPGGLFGESFACAGAPALPISVETTEKSTVLIIDSRRITSPCCNACAFHSQLIRNMLQVVARKNLLLNQKLEITSKRTTREKLMAYLLSQAKQHGSDTFTIPYDRQALADYLEVERSAMSAEISKMRRDRVIECEKSWFRLLVPAEKA